MRELLCPEVTGYESAEEFLFKYFSQSCPATYIMEESGLKEQCDSGKSRSVGDLYWLVKSAFEEVTFEEFIKTLSNVLLENFPSRLLLHCSTVNNITCFNYKSSVVSNRFGKTPIHRYSLILSGEVDSFKNDICEYSIKSIYNIITND